MTDKERLERIIQMQYDGYTIWDMGENDLVWLIKQAERVQELEDKVDELTGLYNSKNSDYLKEKAMREHSWKLNKRYREVIENALEEEEQKLEGYESSVYKILSKALEGNE